MPSFLWPCWCPAWSKSFSRWVFGTHRGQKRKPSFSMR